jgi:hypothetical protein
VTGHVKKTARRWRRWKRLEDEKMRRWKRLEDEKMDGLG